MIACEFACRLSTDDVTYNVGKQKSLGQVIRYSLPTSYGFDTSSTCPIIGTFDCSISHCPPRNPHSIPIFNSSKLRTSSFPSGYFSLAYLFHLSPYSRTSIYSHECVLSFYLARHFEFWTKLAKPTPPNYSSSPSSLGRAKRLPKNDNKTERQQTIHNIYDTYLYNNNTAAQTAEINRGNHN